MRKQQFDRPAQRSRTTIKRILVVAAASLTIFVATIAADDEEIIKVHLVGYQETPLTINSPGSGDFTAKIHSDGTAIDYELTYRDLSSTVLQSHIHFGRPAITGGIVLFLCTNLGNAPASVPVPQACPETNPATITGTLTAANVIPLPVVCPTPTTCSGQAIDSGATGFAEMLKAIRAGAAYVNVHTTNHPSGEVRARLGPHGTGHRDDHDHN
jgi:CHRD domain